MNLPSSSLVIENCEIFGNSEGIAVWNAFGLSGPDILRNDLDNQALDPLLCHPPRSFRLCIHSPALGAGTAGTDIGALGAGCGGFFPPVSVGGGSVAAAGCPSTGPLVDAAPR